MVAGISLLNAIVKSPSTHDSDSPADLEIRVGAELVAASLDEYRHIEAIDLCGPTKKWRRLYVRETEGQMRQLHEAWLASARALLGRLRGIQQAADQIEQLEHAVLHTRGLLRMTLDQIEAGREQARRRESCSVEEVRRELRAETVK